MKSHIVVRGARQHNLKGFDLEIPRRSYTVVTGPSGSGKSSLAFDTIYAEGQRRYVESLSAYARQFLERMEKPNVDFIDGLSPAVAIEQSNPDQDLALDGRHRHRDLRLPAAPLGAHRPHLLPGVRPRDEARHRAVRHRGGARAAGRNALLRRVSAATERPRHARCRRRESARAGISARGDRGRRSCISTSCRPAPTSRRRPSCWWSSTG